MAHWHYQVSETGAGLSRNCVPGVAQVMRMQIWNADLLADLGPGNRLVEVASSQRIAVLVWEHQPRLAVAGELIKLATDAHRPPIKIKICDGQGSDLTTPRNGAKVLSSTKARHRRGTISTRSKTCEMLTAGRSSPAPRQHL
jgi:hypothetical protein